MTNVQRAFPVDLYFPFFLLTLDASSATLIIREGITSFHLEHALIL